MKRLTEKSVIGNYFYLKCFEKCNGLGARSDCNFCELANDICKKLGEYEDLEEQGNLIKIPNEAYFIKDNQIRKGWVQEVVYSVCRKLLLDIRYDDNSLDSYRGYLGNEAFLTKAEAEAKLEDLRGGKNEVN